MLQNKSWTDLVPDGVAAFIQEIDGVNRLQDLSKTDKVQA
jgi:nicotinamide mononucleotide adenylyltransferase